MTCSWLGRRADFLGKLDWLADGTVSQRRKLWSGLAAGVRDWSDCGRSWRLSGGIEPGFGMRTATQWRHHYREKKLYQSGVPISTGDTGRFRKTKTNFLNALLRATNCDYQFEGAGLGTFRLCGRSLKLTAVGSELFSRLGHGFFSQS